MNVQSQMEAAVPSSSCLLVSSIHNCNEDHKITRSTLNKKIECHRRALDNIPINDAISYLKKKSLAHSQMSP